jgi:hypothetical protein
VSALTKKFLGVPFVVIVALGSLVLSLALIILLHGQESSHVSEIVDGKLTIPAKSIWVVIGEHIATALFILGIWHAIDYLFIRKEFNREVIENFQQSQQDLVRRIDDINSQAVARFSEARTDLAKNSKDLKVHFSTAKHDALFGLVSTHHDANQYDLSLTVRSSENFVGVMADGYSWINRHIEAFRQRFRDPNCKTTIILVHPDSDQIQVISRKIGMSPEMYRQRINAAIHQLRTVSGDHNNLRILGHSLISCHSLYVADREIILSPYFMSTQRRIPPVFVVKDAGEGSYFQKLSSDIEYLIKESLEITLPEGVPSGSAIRKTES